jgi:hypothetical protein
VTALLVTALPVTALSGTSRQNVAGNMPPAPGMPPVLRHRHRDRIISVRTS